MVNNKEEEEGLENICSKLDALSLQMLCLMRDYIDCKATLEDLMKTGSLHLAKSRYIMGNRSVSALQLPTDECSEVSASTRIENINTNDDNLCPKLMRLTLKEENESGGVHRRGSSSGGEGGEEGMGGGFKGGKDPLKWFGVLVPQNLRRAQANYDKAVDYVIQAANIQLEMDSTKKQFMALLARKKKILIEATKEEGDSDHLKSS